MPLRKMKMSKKKKSGRSGSRFGMGDEIVKRMTVANGTIALDASGNLSLMTYDASLVFGAPATEFASFAARYQQYRVRWVKVTFTPLYNVSFQVPAGGTTAPILQVYCSDFIGVSVPSSPAQVLADERALIHNTASTFVVRADWARNPNAKLWNPVSAAIPAANDYGIAVASNTSSSGSPFNGIMSYSVEFLVELRGAQ